MSAVGFDIGSSTCFVAATRAGGIDTLDNDYNDRHTPLFTSFNNSRRFTGLAAKNQMMTNAKSTVSNFRNLVGLQFDDPVAQYEMKFYPCRYVKLENGEIGVMVNYLGKEKILSVIQLAASMFSELLSTTKKHLTVFDIAANVPVFFNDYQRKMMIAAAKMSDVNLRCVMNDTSATSVTYSLYNATVNFKSLEEAKVVCFIDVGYSCCQVTVTRYQGSKCTVLAANGVNKFAGRDVDYLMANRFADEFMAKYKKDPRQTPKAWLKLLDESASLKKKINSTGTPLPINIECFLDDLDLHSVLSRDELSAMLLEPVFDLKADDSTTKVSFMDGIRNLIVDTLTEAKCELNAINSVEIIGGSTRLIMVRQLVREFFGKEPCTTLNSDESVARGCTIMCAKYSPSIQIKPFEFTDLVYYDVRAVMDHLNQDTTLAKTIPLYSRGKTSPSVSQLTIKPLADFSFKLQQKIDNDWRDCCNYTVTGVQTNQSDDLVGFRTKLRVRQNESGFCELISAQTEVPAATNPILSETASDKLESTTAAANTIDDEAQSTTNSTTADIAKPTDTSTNNSLTVVSLVISQYEDVELRDFFDKCYLEEKNMLKQIFSEKQRADAKNNFEEFLYILRDKLDGPWNSYVTEDQKDNLKRIINEYEDWLYDEGENETKEVYNEKLASIQTFAVPIRDRMDYFDNFPGIVDRVNSTVMHYKRIHDLMINLHDDYKHLPLESVNKLGEEIELFLGFFTSFEVTAKRADQKSVDMSTLVSLKDVKARYDQLIKVCEPIVTMPKPVDVPPASSVDQATPTAAAAAAATATDSSNVD